MDNIVDEIRAKFEWWYSDNGKSPKAVTRSGPGYYLMGANQAWSAWLAASAEVAALREEMERHKSGAILLHAGMNLLRSDRSETAAAERADAARMDWLERDCNSLGWDADGCIGVVAAAEGETFTGDSYREAIDAAIKAEAKR